KHMYALPQTILKVEVTTQELVDVPGPYWESADKYLGITEVINKKASRWRIHDVKVTAHAEMDPRHAFTLNLLEGEVNWDFMEHLLEKGIIVDGTKMVHEETSSPMLGSGQDLDYLHYVDLGIYSNFEERTETMYKTLVTDTSYVRVPVQRTIVEQKSPLMKASEAADFILDLRARRFDMLTGEYEVFPQGEAMDAAIKKLDQLEESYLSLFTGKTISRMERRAYFIVPETGPEPSTYRLGLFSGQLGFVPEELMEGNPLEVLISPAGQTTELESYFAGNSEEISINQIYYRLPDVVELKVVMGEEMLSTQRISIYQSGAIVRIPVNL
ncbi:MAG: DUF4831 family protein, partial [Bacteroidales bacterium]|nr:DUF4831 family protein [Bacteroidales bacterium]